MISGFLSPSMNKKNVMKRARIIIGIITLSFFALNVQAQKGKDDSSRFGHGEDSVTCITNLSLYRQYAKNRNFDMAYGYWKIVFDECPKASKNIYLDGVKIYRSKLGKISLRNEKENW
jgi:hypothetical protein